MLLSDNNKTNILIGNIIDNGSYFKLEYIFDYKNEEILKQELNIIVNNYDYYLNNNLYFNRSYQNDYISPIFSENGKN